MSGIHTSRKFAILTSNAGINLSTYTDFSGLLEGAAFMHYGATNARQTADLLRKLANDIEGHGQEG